MTSLNEYRTIKKFQKKHKNKISDAIAGLDYASAVKYNPVNKDNKTESSNYIRNLIQFANKGFITDKGVQNGQETRLNKFLDKKRAKQMINTLSTGDQYKQAFNPLLKKIWKTQIKQPSPSILTKLQAIQLQKVYQSTINRDFTQQQNQRQYILPEISQNELYRVIVKQRGGNKNKQRIFVKYPSSSLLKTNPQLYKQNAQLQTKQILQNPNPLQQQDQLKSSFYKNKNYFKTKRLNTLPTRLNSLSEERQSKSVQCSRKNKIYAHKTFYNKDIMFMTRRNDNLRPKQVCLNKYVQQRIQLLNSHKNRQQQNIVNGEQSINKQQYYKNQEFNVQNISMYLKQRFSQLRNRKILEGKSSRTNYFKCWSVNKNKQNNGNSIMQNEQQGGQRLKSMQKVLLLGKQKCKNKRLSLEGKNLNVTQKNISNSIQKSRNIENKSSKSRKLKTQS